jgi:poly(hydroxyalkanoate) depolymerase family esterase
MSSVVFRQAERPARDDQDERNAAVPGLRQTFANIICQQQQQIRWWTSFRVPTPDTAPNKPEASQAGLTEIADFGSNPGALRMLVHLAKGLPPGAPLVVVLHGCTQSAAAFDRACGWSELASRFGFALLLPEQRQANNSKDCFNWFAVGDARRDVGEALSIRQMVDRMVADYGLDPGRVYVAGLSAGGAMAMVMLATYPEVFAGGAIIGGLPYGSATNSRQARPAMEGRQNNRPASGWGAAVDLPRALAPGLDLARRRRPIRAPGQRRAAHGAMDRSPRPRQQAYAGGAGRRSPAPRLVRTRRRGAT